MIFLNTFFQDEDIHGNGESTSSTEAAKEDNAVADNQPSAVVTL